MAPGIKSAATMVPCIKSAATMVPCIKSAATMAPGIKSAVTMTTGAIVGVVVGVVMLCILLVVCVVCFYQRSRGKQGTVIRNNQPATFVTSTGATASAYPGMFSFHFISQYEFYGS